MGKFYYVIMIQIGKGKVNWKEYSLHYNTRSAAEDIAKVLMECRKVPCWVERREYKKGVK